MTLKCAGKTVFLNEILSKRTAYGLIWGGTYLEQPCVIKVIMLTTGIHFDKNTGLHLNGKGKKISSTEVQQCFGSDGPNPFKHTEFIHRRSMTPDAFLLEANNLIRLNQLNLAPTMHGYGFCNQLFKIHYAFIVMQRVDETLKDIFILRKLKTKEDTMVEEMINKLHQTYGIVHGDMKPSNIGVTLDAEGQIIASYFLDCQKIKYRQDYDEKSFNRLILSDWHVYRKHIIKNRTEDALINKKK